MPLINTAKNLKLGATQVKRAYLGAIRVWPPETKVFVTGLEMRLRSPVVAPSYTGSNASPFVSRTSIPVALTGIPSDLMVVFIFIRALGPPPEVTAPYGWALLFAPSEVNDGALGGRLYGWWKQRQEGDPGNATFYHATAESQHVALTYSDVDGIAPLDVEGIAKGFGTQSVAPDTTSTRYPSDTLIYVGHDWVPTDNARTPPTGIAERFDSILYAGDRPLTALGQTGDATQANLNPADKPWQAGQIALVPNGVTVKIVSGQKTTLTAPPAMQVQIGSVEVHTSSSIPVNGFQLFVRQGDVIGRVDCVVNVTADPLTVQLGSLDNVTGTAVVKVTGTQMTVLEGLLTGPIRCTVFVTGLEMKMWAGPVNRSLVVRPTGVSMTVSTGIVTVRGKATVRPTGVAMTVNRGSVTLRTNQTIMISGFGLKMSLGGVFITGSGVAASSPYQSEGMMKLGSNWMGGGGSEEEMGSMLIGTGVPSNALGKVGDVFLDTASGKIYGPKNPPGGGYGLAERGWPTFIPESTGGQPFNIGDQLKFNANGRITTLRFYRNTG